MILGLCSQRLYHMLLYNSLPHCACTQHTHHVDRLQALHDLLGEDEALWVGLQAVVLLLLCVHVWV